MKIEWALDDPQLCNGCPCLSHSDATARNKCGLGYELWASVIDEKTTKYVIRRPEHCRRRNGD